MLLRFEGESTQTPNILYNNKKSLGLKNSHKFCYSKDIPE